MSVEHDTELLTKLRLTYETCTEKRSEQLARSSNNVVCRRPASGALKFAVGMNVKNETGDLNGVILSWDLHCKQPDDWIEKYGIRNLARGVDQPFYEILDDDGNTYYEAEGNMFGSKKNINQNCSKQF